MFLVHTIGDFFALPVSPKVASNPFVGDLLGVKSFFQPVYKLYRKRFMVNGQRRAIVLASLLLCIIISLKGIGQNCPPNIDFETGNLNGWKCYTGNVSNQGGVNVFSLTESGGPVDGQHTIIPSSANGYDPYGNFSTNSPNGSAYCVKLGNDQGGGQAEAISYEFTIPANRNVYSLIYYYAVVFQDPNHQIYEQPRMEIEITNLTTGARIDCASFSFIPYGSGLPGFFESPIVLSNTPIWCKGWSPVSINLDGNAGSTIRLTFRTGDCTFRRHFGYAYIDVNTDCSGQISGANYCPQDPEITVNAPYGFQSYTWYNSSMNSVVGTGQSLTLSPIPPAGTVFNAQVEPYAGYGCAQTISVKLDPNLVVAAVAGNDTISCNREPVRLGGLPTSGVMYRWSPDVGLSNAGVSNPIATPSITTDYVLTATSPGGGCVDSDTVHIKASNLAAAMLLQGDNTICLGPGGDSLILTVTNTDTIRWYKDGIMLPGAVSNQYRVTQGGVYTAYLSDTIGCSATTSPQSVAVYTIPTVAFGVNNAAQCLVNNQFVFTNTSTNPAGTMTYAWNFGGAGTSAVRDPSYNFTSAGQYKVSLVVSSNGFCPDSASALVSVYPNPVPAFADAFTCIELPFIPVNTTNENIGSPIHYTWNYSNGFSSNLKTPQPVVFTTGGSYQISLSAYSDQCPTPVQTLTKKLTVESPAAARRYTTAFAVKDYPISLSARSIGVSAEWLPAIYLNNSTNYNPVFRGFNDVDYTVALTTKGGCVTVDSILVQLVDKANILVPNAFTPNGDGLNDYLRPIGMGITEIRYFRILNRWGQLVYESNSEKPGWDGRLKGVEQASQTFVWMVEGVGVDGTVITRKGTSVLIR